jgi:glycerophosphoryl diester phosphodiesterase
MRVRLMAPAAAIVAVILGAGPAFSLLPVAHRGDREFHQEDTVSSINAAYKLAPHGTTESDVWWLKDSAGNDQAIIMHDSTLDRATNCTGDITSYTSTWILTHCRVDLLTTVRSQPVATLGEELHAVQHNPGQRIHLDLKGTWTDSQVKHFRRMVVGHHLLDRTSVMTPDDNMLLQFKRVEPTIRTAWRRHSATKVTISPTEARTLGVSIVMIWKPAFYSKAYVTAMHNAGLVVWNQVIDDPATWDLVASWGVDRSLTNVPTLFARHFPASTR